MKEKMKKLYCQFLKVLPVVATFMLIIGSNSAETWARGQEEMPDTAKKYRKF